VLKPELARRFIRAKDEQKWYSRNWVADEKLNGIRVRIVSNGKGENILVSRTDKPIKLEWLEKTLLPAGEFDGEITYINGGDNTETIHAICANPDDVQVILFDYLEKDGRSMIELPWLTRRLELEKFLLIRMDKRIRLSRTDFDRKKEFFNEIVSLGGEGIILKDTNASYCPGSRANWIKFPKWKLFDLIVTRVGRREGTKSDEAGMMDLYYGSYINGELVEAGSLGVFGTEEELKQYVGKVVEVRGKRQYKTGAVQHHQIVRWRDDKLPEECVIY
jgi:ATP-dependent DNA ligase